MKHGDCLSKSANIWTMSPKSGKLSSLAARFNSDSVKVSSSRSFLIFYLSVLGGFSKISSNSSAVGLSSAAVTW